MAKYCKKPVVINAWQWDETKETFESLLKEGMKYGGYTSHETENFVRNLTIQTLEGLHKADKNDWIIKGIKNEFYPCKPDIFEKTYELVED